MKISVIAHPKSKQAKVVEKSPGCYEIWVREAADRGKANAPIIEAISEHLGISKCRIEIIRGFSSKNKLIEVK